MNAFIEKVRKALKRRLKYWTWTQVIWLCQQEYFRWRMRYMNPKQRNRTLQSLSKKIVQAEGKCALTVTFGARYFGNRDNLLENFINSFLKMTEDYLRVEILIKVDLDDNLLFFHRIKEKYGSKINLCFFPSERGGGYADMHIWHTTLMKHRTHSSKALVILTEDAEFVFKHWDRNLMDLIDALPHPYFIGAPCSLEETISILGPNPVIPVPIYWIRGDDYPVVSFQLLEVTGRVAQQYPGWTAMGNLLLVDGFSGDLLRSMWLRHKVNSHFEFPQLFQRLGIFSWSESPQRAKLRNDSLIKFFLKENQAVRDEMADAIVQEINHH